MPEREADIGAMLRETRMRARIDIAEVELKTKIRAKYLRAIENEEWDLLPGPVYVKSFLRTYGDYLGLDSRLLVDEYKRRYEFAPDAQGRPLSAVKRERERERERASRPSRGPAVPSWAIILLVLVVAAAGLYLIGRGGGSSSSSSSSKSSESALGTPGTVTKTTPATHTATRPITTATKTTPVVPTQATLKLVPTGTTWVCVQTQGGAKPIDGVIESTGTTLPEIKASQLLVRLGNTEITVTANGKAFTLTPSATPIDLKITPTGITTTTQAPSCA
jgi:cytoskeleton protein RodZ